MVHISKQANKEIVSVGDLVAYELEVENRRPKGAINKIWVKDRLPLGFRYVKGTARIYRKDKKGKYRKAKIDPQLGGRAMYFYIHKLKEHENLKITYILRVGTGVSPGMYENIADVRNKKDGIISNTARALVQVVLDRLFQTSNIIGKVFHDRDGDGWQDDATGYGIRIKTLTNQDNYERIDGYYINVNRWYWSYKRIKMEK